MYIHGENNFYFIFIVENNLQNEMVMILYRCKR